jgi:hypothetical protein
MNVLNVMNFMKPLLLVFALFLLGLTRPGYAQVASVSPETALNAESAESIDSPVEWQKRSHATATWLWLDIYEATLFTTSDFNQAKLLDDSEPLKLQLCYLKPIGKEDLAKGSEAVLPQRLSPDLKQAVAGLHENYQDVSPGDCYILEYIPEIGTQLKLNNKLAFATQKKGFKSIYFGIWLGDNPLSVDLKEALLNPLMNVRQKPILKSSLEKIS